MKPKARRLSSFAVRLFRWAPPESRLSSVPIEKARHAVRAGLCVSCGGGGIRTHDTREGMPVFKTGAFNQAPPPLRYSAPKLRNLTSNDSRGNSLPNDSNLLEWADPADVEHSSPIHP